MRHRKTYNHLGRTSSHRKAMLANMAASLIMHKKIRTTIAKAKALRIYVEPLLTKSKNDSTHSRRMVFSYLQNKDAVTELFREVSPKIIDRPGGYTRILKTGARLGDSADMCIIELVDYNQNLLSAKLDTKETAVRRRRRGGKKKVDDATTPGKSLKTEAIEEVSIEEAKVVDNEESKEVLTEKSGEENNDEVQENSEKKKNE
jgi:large subunit ribosomal protein L17